MLCTNSKGVNFFSILSHSCKGEIKFHSIEPLERGKKVSKSWYSRKQVSCTHSTEKSFRAGQLGDSTGGRLCVQQKASPPDTGLSL